MLSSVTTKKNLTAMCLPLLRHVLGIDFLSAFYFLLYTSSNHYVSTCTVARVIDSFLTTYYIQYPAVSQS